MALAENSRILTHDRNARQDLLRIGLRTFLKQAIVPQVNHPFSQQSRFVCEALGTTPWSDVLMAWCSTNQQTRRASGLDGRKIGNTGRFSCSNLGVFLRVFNGTLLNAYYYLLREARLACSSYDAPSETEWYLNWSNPSRDHTFVCSLAV
jgi:hypothetical protein